MGGTLLKTKRISSKKYNSLVNELEECYLIPMFGKENYFIPRSIKDKRTFGDVDVNLKSSVCVPDWNTFIQKTILPNIPHSEYKTFKGGVSLKHQDFTIDFFCRSKKNFDIAYYFLSDNCLGNIIGKIAKRIELKYGESGLSYVFRRDDSSYIKEYLISQDFKAICNFLDLDYQRYQQGFTYEELFKWVIDSKYFTTDPFLNPKGTIKKRLKRERPTLLKFIKFLEKNKINQPIVKDYKDNIVSLVDDFFSSNLAEFIKEEKEREKIVNSIKEKFNGNLIMNQFPSLTGKNLGVFIGDFKKLFTDEDFESFILNNDQSTINSKIHEYYFNTFSKK